RPLWELYLIEGLADDRVAVITKTHQSMIDESGGVDIVQLMLDATAEPDRTVRPLWMPEPEPTSAALVTSALLGVARRPTAIVDTVRLGINDLRSTAGRLRTVV